MGSPVVSNTTFRRAARLLGRASAFSGAMLVGHAIGILLVLCRLTASESLNDAAQRGEADRWGYLSKFYSFNPHASSLHLSKYSHYAFTEYLMFAPWGNMFLPMLAVVTAALLVTRYTPIRFAPGEFASARDSVRAAVRSNWRLTLGAARLNRALSWFAGATVGFAAAIVGEAYATLQVYLVEERDLSGTFVAGTTRFLPYPRPIWDGGLWTGADLVLVLGSCFVLTAGVVILDARRRWADDAALRNQWCVGCGYPALSTGLAGAATSSTCPECGRKANPQPSAATRIKHSAFWFNVAVTAVLAGSMLVFFAVPRVLPQQP